MWTRAELKQRGREDLKTFFWYALLAAIITSVLVGIVTGIMGFLLFFIRLVPWIGEKIASPIETIIIGFFVLVILTGFNRFMVLSIRRRQSAGIGEVFSCFQQGRFTYVAEKEFALSAIIGLWSSLLVIPGTIKRYEYFMVPYLVAEYPDRSGRDLFKISREIMDGHKMNAFVLELSFIGWYLLGALLLGLGLPVAALYHQATMTELYFWLKDQYFRSAEGKEYAALVGEGGMVSSPSGMGTGYLVGKQGGFTGARIPLAPGDEILIGSDASMCSLVVDGPQVSSVHVKVTFNGSSFVVTDYSDAGTYNLQGGRLPSRQPVTLQAGAYLQIGTSGDVFSLEY